MDEEWGAFFPRLSRDNYAVTSPATDRYNCVAWAAGYSDRWWWPAGFNYWPASSPRDVSLEAFQAAFVSLGYASCADGVFTEGFEKIAIFAKRIDSRLVPTHVARQLSDGSWTSKLGPDRDIVHQELEDLVSDVYGMPVAFMRRGW